MSVSLQDYYSAYRVSVYKDLFLPNYVQYAKDTYIADNRTFFEYITSVKDRVECALALNDREGFFRELITHKNAIMGILERMVSQKIEPSKQLDDRGAKFFQGVIGTIGNNRWILPNCSVKNKTDGLNIYVDELRLMKVNQHFSNEIIDLKLANPECKVLLINQNLKAIQIYRLNYVTVYDWTAPLPYECLEEF